MHEKIKILVAAQQRFSRHFETVQGRFLSADGDASV